MKRINGRIIQKSTSEDVVNSIKTLNTSFIAGKIIGNLLEYQGTQKGYIR